MYVHYHTCLFRMFVVSGLFERCSMYLCIAYTLTLVAFSNSFIFMVLVFVAFAYCSHAKDIRLLRVTIRCFGFLYIRSEFSFRVTNGSQFLRYHNLIGMQWCAEE